MTALKVVLLICGVATPRPDCTLDTALDVINGPDLGALAACDLQSQAYIASTALAGRLDEQHYLKILCRPEPGLRAATERVAPGEALAVLPSDRRLRPDRP